MYFLNKKKKYYKLEQGTNKKINGYMIVTYLWGYCPGMTGDTGNCSLIDPTPGLLTSELSYWIVCDPTIILTSHVILLQVF